MDVEDDVDAYRAALTDVLGPVAPSTEGLASWVEAIIDLSLAQRAQLIYGEVDGVRPPVYEKRNGIAYLEGWDTFADIGSAFTRYACTCKSSRRVAPRPRLSTPPRCW